MVKGVETRVFAPIPAEVERVGKAVLDAAFKIHTALGPVFVWMFW